MKYRKRSRTTFRKRAYRKRKIYRKSKRFGSTNKKADTGYYEKVKVNGTLLADTYNGERAAWVNVHPSEAGGTNDHNVYLSDQTTFGVLGTLFRDFKVTYAKLKVFPVRDLDYIGAGAQPLALSIESNAYTFSLVNQEQTLTGFYDLNSAQEAINFKRVYNNRAVKLGMKVSKVHNQCIPGTNAIVPVMQSKGWANLRQFANADIRFNLALLSYVWPLKGTLVPDGQKVGEWEVTFYVKFRNRVPT